MLSVYLLKLCVDEGAHCANLSMTNMTDYIYALPTILTQNIGKMFYIIKIQDGQDVYLWCTQSYYYSLCMED